MKNIVLLVILLPLGINATAPEDKRGRMPKALLETDFTEKNVQSMIY